MEVNALHSVMLLLVTVGLLLGAGILTLDKFGQAVYNDEVITENVTPSTGVEVALSQGNLTQYSSVINATTLTTLVSTNYTVNKTWGTFCLLSNETAHGQGKVQITYTWRNYETVTEDVMDDVVGAVDDLPNTWISLIVIVIMLAIILTLVLTAFVRRGGR